MTFLYIYDLFHYSLTNDINLVGCSNIKTAKMVNIIGLNANLLDYVTFYHHQFLFLLTLEYIIYIYKQNYYFT